MALYPRAILLIVFFAAFHPALAEESSTPSRWLGRVNEVQREFGWPGSGLEIAFEGTFLDVQLADSGKNSLIVSIDGKPSRLDLQKGESNYRIADGLQPGRHVARVSRRTEGMFGNTRFVSAKTDGRFLAQPTPQRRLLVVGDSISAGYGVEGKALGCKNGANAQSHYLSYASVAGRALDADVTTLAISGIGVTRPEGTKRNSMVDVIDRVTPNASSDNDAGSQAGDDFQAIVVNLGTNDFGSGRRPSSFADHYNNLLSKLRSQHPDALIYAALGPMLSDADFGAAEAAIRNVVASRRSPGDANLRYLSLRVAEKDYGCDWHPGPAAQVAVAEILVRALERDLGWSAIQ